MIARNWKVLLVNRSAIADLKVYIWDLVFGLVGVGSVSPHTPVLPAQTRRMNDVVVSSSGLDS